MKKQLMAASLACLLAACHNTESQPAASQTDAIPVQEPAKVAYWAPRQNAAARRGAELALHEANAKAWKIAGKSVRFTLHNMANGPNDSWGQTLAKQQPVAALGHFDADQAAVLDAQGLPTINLSTSGRSADNPHVFYLHATAAQQGSLIARYLLAQNLNHIAIVSHGQQTELTQTLQNHLQAAGVQAHLYILGQTTSADLKQLVAQLAQAQPQIVFYSGDEPSAIQLIHKLHQQPLLIPVVLSGRAFGDKLPQQTGRRGLGTMAIVAGLPLAQMNGADTFRQAFEQQFGVQPNEQAAYAYDAAWALISAMKLADSTDPAVYLPKLQSLNMSGGLLTGALTFDNHGWRNEATLTVYQVEDQGWQAADSIKANPNQATLGKP